MKIKIPSGGQILETGALIGRGQLGDVYVAGDAGQHLAVKVFTGYRSAPAKVEDALRRASWAGKVLSEMPQQDLRIAPGLQPVLVLDAENEWPGLLMQRVSGVNCADWLKTKPSVAARLQMLHCLLRGLATMHGLGVAHNDISFGNLLISDIPALLDFDRAGDMSPELLRDGVFYVAGGAGISHDLRAFAILATLMLEGFHPFTADLPELLQGTSGFDAPLRLPDNPDWARFLAPALTLANELTAQDLLTFWPREDH